MLALCAGAASGEPKLAKQVDCWRGTIDVKIHLDAHRGFDAHGWEGHAEVQLREERETSAVVQMSVDRRDSTEEGPSTADLWYDWIEWSVKQDAYIQETRRYRAEYEGFEASETSQGSEIGGDPWRPLGRRARK